MSLPSPEFSPPDLAVDQFSFQGVTIGPNTPFGIKKIEGLDKPNVRTQNQSRPRTNGSFVGLNLLDVRDVTLTIDVGPFLEGFGDYGSLQGALEALTVASSTEGTTEYPLWIQLRNGPFLCAMARVTKKPVVIDVAYDTGQIAQNIPIQFEATDPTLYAAPTLEASVGLPTDISAGFAFPMTFPLDFGGGSGGNIINVQNNGDIACAPTLVITGPCTNPTVTNASIPGSPSVDLDVTLNAGDQLIIDNDIGSILYLTAGSSEASPLPNALAPGSQFFSLVPGVNEITFTSSDLGPVAGTLTLWYASAYDAAT